MYDLNFDAKEFIEVSRELVPSYQQPMVIEAILSDITDESSFDKIGMKLTGEETITGIIVPTGAPKGPSDSMWAAIKSEMFDFLCTTSKKYATERKEGGITIKQVISIVATAVASTFNIAVGVVTGAVVLVLLSSLKVGKNAWCKINTPA